MMKRADAAMYAAKRRGRNLVSARAEFVGRSEERGGVLHCNFHLLSIA